MTDWYRRQTWTKADEDEFFVKLGRAHKENRPQYLRVQALELISTKDVNLLTVAESLLTKLLAEYPDNRTEKSPAFNALGEIYLSYQDYDKALEYFKKSLEFEKEFPNVLTTAYLNFAETAVLAGKTDLYDVVLLKLTDKLKEDTIRFPVQNYIIYSVLSIIFNHKGDRDQAKVYADLADKYASAKTNSLWNKQKQNLGTVKERVSWLDKLVRRK